MSLTVMHDKLACDRQQALKEVQIAHCIGNYFEDHGDDGHPQEAVLKGSRIVDVSSSSLWGDNPSMRLAPGPMTVAQTLHSQIPPLLHLAQG